MELLRLASIDEVCSKAAAFLAEATAARRKAGAGLHWGLCGGRTVAEIFKRLADQASLDWTGVHLFMADERVVPRTSADWNGALVEEHLIGPLTDRGRLEESQWHPFLADEASPDGGAAAYTSRLAERGGRLDLLLLSVGEDGHVASLFPGHASLAETEKKYLAEVSSPKPPSRRISASPALIRDAAGVVLLFTGEGKRGALARFLEDGVDFTDCPCRLLRTHPGLVVLTDLSI